LLKTPLFRNTNKLEELMVNFACFNPDENEQCTESVFDVDFFKGNFPSLLILNAGGCQIGFQGEPGRMQLANDSFASLTSVTHMLLESNLLERLPVRLFERTTNVVSLSLESNKITLLETNMFMTLTKLLHLTLSGNGVPNVEESLKLQPGCFNGLGRLEELFLESPGEIDATTLVANVFEPLVSLNSLQLTVLTDCDGVEPCETWKRVEFDCYTPGQGRFPLQLCFKISTLLLDVGATPIVSEGVSPTTSTVTSFSSSSLTLFYSCNLWSALTHAQDLCCLRCIRPEMIALMDRASARKMICPLTEALLDVIAQPDGAVRFALLRCCLHLF
jgi:hypothetical protein